MNDIKMACFFCSARTKSFSVAADELLITHQAVSKNIAGLEEEVGYTLFSRNGSDVSLTRAGEILFNHLKDFDKRMEHANDRLFSKDGRAIQRLRIGFPDWIGIPESADMAIRQIAISKSDLEIQEFIGSETELKALMGERKVDVINMTSHEDLNCDADTFIAENFEQIELKLICSGKLFGKDGAPDYDAILSLPLLACTSNEMMQSHLTKLHETLALIHRCRCGDTIILSNFSSVLSECAMCNGFTFAPDIAFAYNIHPAMAHIKILPLRELRDSKISLSSMWRASPYFTYGLQYVENVIQNVGEKNSIEV